MSIDINLDPTLACEAAILVDLVELWRAQAAGDAMPPWRAFDPIKLPPKLLPHIYLIDGVAEVPIRPRWRLLGTHTTTTLGRDNTGKYFDEVYSAEDAADMAKPVHWVVEHAAPVRLTGVTHYVGKDWLSYEAVNLPYAAASGGIGMILGGVVYSSVDTTQPPL